MFGSFFWYRLLSIVIYSDVPGYCPPISWNKIDYFNGRPKTDDILEQQSRNVLASFFQDRSYSYPDLTLSLYITVFRLCVGRDLARSFISVRVLRPVFRMILLYAHVLMKLAVKDMKALEDASVAWIIMFVKRNHKGHLSGSSKCLEVCLLACKERVVSVFTSSLNLKCNLRSIIQRHKYWCLMHPVNSCESFCTTQLIWRRHCGHQGTRRVANRKRKQTFTKSIFSKYQKQF